MTKERWLESPREEGPLYLPAEPLGADLIDFGSAHCVWWKIAEPCMHSFLWTD